MNINLFTTCVLYNYAVQFFVKVNNSIVGDDAITITVTMHSSAVAAFRRLTSNMSKVETDLIKMPVKSCRPAIHSNKEFKNRVRCRHVLCSNNM